MAEAEAVAELSSLKGMQSLTQSLRDLKAQGLGGVTITEETVGSLISSGQVEIAEGNAVVGLTALDAKLLPDLKRALTQRFPSENVGQSPDGKTILVAFATPGQVRATSIGIPPELCDAAERAEILIVARCANPPGASAQTVTKTLEWATERGADYFLPLGDQVLGRRENIKLASETLRRLKMPYASPEFGKLGGDANMLMLDPGNVVRLHAAQAAELDKLPLSEAVDRYARAAKERNMRILLLRPIAGSSDDPLGDFGDFVKQVGKEIQASGYTLGEPHAFGESAPPGWLFAVVGLLAAPVTVWLALTLLSGWVAMALAGLAVLVGVGSIVEAARGPAAILAGLAFPIAAYVLLDRREGKNTVVEFVLMSFISLTGGLVIAALHNGLPFTVRADQFSGVKLTHFLPIALIGLYYFSRISRGKESLAAPITWNQGLLALGVMAVLLLMATRTGNDNPAAVSGVELKFRALLDQLLFVRPRTKEFMIGHPLLFVGIGAVLAHRAGNLKLAPGWVALILAVSAIGQTSIVNTMCHFHTPLVLSLARIAVGLVAGGILGAGVWVLAKRALVSR